MILPWQNYRHCVDLPTVSNHTFTMSLTWSPMGCSPATYSAWSELSTMSVATGPSVTCLILPSMIPQHLDYVIGFWLTPECVISTNTIWLFLLKAKCTHTPLIFHLSHLHDTFIPCSLGLKRLFPHPNIWTSSVSSVNFLNEEVRGKASWGPSSWSEVTMEVEELGTPGLLWKLLLYHQFDPRDRAFLFLVATVLPAPCLMPGRVGPQQMYFKM